MGNHVNIMQCMQYNFLLTGHVYPMFIWSVLVTLTETVPFLN